MNEEVKKRYLAYALRIMGLVQATALIAVFMPHSWMDAIHRYLGLGTLPDIPMVGYLARTESALYVLLGVMLIFISFDVDRYLPVIRLVGVLVVLGGAGVMILDVLLGMPPIWRIMEGPVVIALGIMILVLSAGVDGKGS